MGSIAWTIAGAIILPLLVTTMRFDRKGDFRSKTGWIEFGKELFVALILGALVGFVASCIHERYYG